MPLAGVHTEVSAVAMACWVGGDMGLRSLPDISRMTSSSVVSLVILGSMGPTGLGGIEGLWGGGEGGGLYGEESPNS